MSSYMVIARVSETLRNILWEAFQSDTTTADIIDSLEEITFKNPTETARDSANRLSLWLHQVTENEYVKNQPMVRSNTNGSGHDKLQFPALALNLYYLVTPFAPSGNPGSEHMLLGKAMQAFFDNAIVELHDDTEGEEINEELRVIFCRLSLEELTRIWEALREPYRLSVCYLVRVTRIDSRRKMGAGRVKERIGGFSDKPADVKGNGS